MQWVDINLRLFCHLWPWPVITTCSSLLVEIWFFHVVFSFSAICIASSTQSVCISWLKNARWRDIAFVFWRVDGEILPWNIVWDVYPELCVFFSLRLAYFQMRGVTEGFSDIITIYSFLKAFQAKIFFQSLCCALARVSISTLASLTGYVTW